MPNILLQELNLKILKRSTIFLYVVLDCRRIRNKKSIFTDRELTYLLRHEKMSRSSVCWYICDNFESFLRKSL